MNQQIYRVKVNIMVSRVTAKMTPQGPGEFVDFGMNSEAMGEGVTEKAAYEAAMANGAQSFADRLQAVLPMPSGVVTPFPQA